MVSAKDVGLHLSDPNGQVEPPNCPPTDGRHESLLACAHRTWMRAWQSPLDVLLLVDCKPFCQPQRNMTQLARERCSKGAVTSVTTVNDARFGTHEDFYFDAAAWLARPKSHIRYHLRCSWVKYTSGAAYLKTASLLRAMLNALPRKRFYLKVDDDAVLLPHNLLAFLRSMHVNVHPDSMLYFGSSRAGPGARVAPLNKAMPDDDSRHAFRFTRNRSVYQKRVSGPKMKSHGTGRAWRLRDTPSWRRMESQFLPNDARPVANRTLEVTYALGGAYGMSRSALEAVQQHGCFRRLPSLRSPKACCLRRGAIHLNEDAAVGVCMHLSLVRLIECDSFRHGILTRAKRRVGMEELDMLMSKEKSMLAADDSAQAQLPRHVIALHPVKTARMFAKWWNILLRRDALYVRSLPGNQTLQQAQIDGWRRFVART